MKKYQKIIGMYCKDFRVKVLGITLREVEESTNIKTISGWEHGRSTNINHLIKYIKKCKNTDQRNQFLIGLINKLEGEQNAN